MKLTPKTMREVLLGACDLIEEEKAWLKGFFASTQPSTQSTFNSSCEPTSPAAVSFCARGAIRRKLSELGGDGSRYSPDELAIADDWRPTADICLKRTREIAERIPEVSAPI